MKGATRIILLLLSLLPGCGKDEVGENDIHVFPQGEIYRLREVEDVNFSSPSWSPDGESIVCIGAESKRDPGSYQWDSINKSNLWLISADGAIAEVLLETPGRDCNPMWHPNPSLREIVFMSYRGTGDDTVYTIYRYNLDEDELTNTYEINSQIDFPSYSHDGEHIVFRVPVEGGGLMRVPVEGGEAEMIENLDGWGTVTRAECSPGEPVVAFYQVKDKALNVFAISIYGGHPEQLTDYGLVGRVSPYGYSEPGNNYCLSWHKDGLRLVITYLPDQDLIRRMWKADDVMSFISRDGGEQLYLGGYLNSPNMSPEGTKIIGDGLWLMDLTKL
ncbi:TolB family protein [candidate division KSB1 bacterium]